MKNHVLLLPYVNLPKFSSAFFRSFQILAYPDSSFLNGILLAQGMRPAVNDSVLAENGGAIQPDFGLTLQSPESFPLVKASCAIAN